MTLDPQQLASIRTQATLCAERFHLPLRNKVWRGGTGEFAGSGSGSSLDFQDHRIYVPGDDPRHLNWQAYARTGQYSMKLYREEVRPVIDIICDVSPSMFVDEAKSKRTSELLLLLYLSSTRAGASCRVHLCSGSTHRLLAPEALSGTHWLETAKTLQESDPDGPLALQNIPMRASSFRVLISDLLFPGDPGPILRLLAAGQGSPFLFVPFSESESEPSWEGNYEFVDAERGSKHPHRIDPRIIKRYLTAYRQHFALWKEACTRQQAHFARVSAQASLERALLAEAVPSQSLEMS